MIEGGVTEVHQALQDEKIRQDKWLWESRRNSRLGN
jgi:hypothetical protein